MTLPSANSTPLTRRLVLQQAWPIILATASVPLLGMVDSAVIGHYGSTDELAALALGALFFNFVYWGFGFLRMATTGFVARASGAGDRHQLAAAVLRPLLLGLGIGMALCLLQWPLACGFHTVMAAGPAVSASSQDYVLVRIWGAPAALALYALCGALIGQGRSAALLAVQLLLNGSNALLDIYLAGWLGLGVYGIGLGTALAEWGSCLFALWLVWRCPLPGRSAAPLVAATVWRKLLGDRVAWRQMWVANGDLLVRTVCLLAGFAWFARLGGQLGAATLAANHLLLQLVAFSAFFLDGFAHVAEARVGAALGGNARGSLRRIVRVTSELALLSALLLSALLWLGGAPLLGLLTSLDEVLVLAHAQLPWVALYVLLSVAAFQLDGVCIGAMATAAMRRAAVCSLLVFLPAAWLGQHYAGNPGLWAAMLVFVVARAVFLWPAWHRLQAGPALP